MLIVRIMILIEKCCEEKNEETLEIWHRNVNRSNSSTQPTHTTTNKNLLNKLTTMREKIKKSIAHVKPN